MLDAGIYILDKPSGVSSAKAIAKLKHKLSLKKIGHAGTLDPMATGVLVCLVNGATKFASYAEAGRKIYSGSILLGTTTNSDDIQGEVISTSNNISSFEEINSASKEFVGDILQIPPQVSAIKQNGVPAYKKVRKGESVTIEPRAITIYSIDLFPSQDPKMISFKIECSKGTYIRSIARDLGLRLGCGGCLASLRREYSSPFFVEQAKTLENINDNDMLAWWKLFPNVSKITLADDVATRLHHGDEIMLNNIANEIPSDNMVIYGNKESWLGMLEKDSSGIWKFAVNL